MSHIAQNPANFPTLPPMWSQLLFDGTMIECPRLDRSCTRTSAGVMFSDGILDFIRCSVGFHLIDRVVDDDGTLMIRCDNGFVFFVDESIGLNVKIYMDLALYDEAKHITITSDHIDKFFLQGPDIPIPTDFNVNHLCEPFIANYATEHQTVAMYSCAFNQQLNAGRLL